MYRNKVEIEALEIAQYCIFLQVLLVDITVLYNPVQYTYLSKSEIAHWIVEISSKMRSYGCRYFTYSAVRPRIFTVHLVVSQNGGALLN